MTEDSIRHTKISHPNQMNCPYCKAEMEEGLCRVAYNIFDLHLLPGGDMGLYFKAPDNKRILLLGRTNPKESFYCKHCETVIIEGARSKDIPCPDCGGTIPAGSYHCLNCRIYFNPDNQPVEY